MNDFASSNSPTAWLVVAVIGALVVVVSFFLGYISFSALGFTKVQSGMEIMSNDDLTGWKYLPLMCLILAVVSLLVSVARRGNVARGALIAPGLVIVIMSVVFLMMVENGSIVNEQGLLSDAFMEFLRVEPGLYVTIIGGIILAMEGLLPAKGN